MSIFDSKPKPLERKPIRSISIDCIEFGGQYGCDLNIRYRDGDTAIKSTELYSTEKEARRAAKTKAKSLMEWSRS